MRFLMLNWRDPGNPKSGGAERVSRAYLGELVRRGHEVFWYANNFPGAKPEETYDGIKIIRGGGMGSSVWQAVKWHRRYKPFDLIIDQHHGIPWYAPWWSGTNVVAYIHEVLGPIWKSFYPQPVSTLGMWQERRTLWCYRNVPFWTPSESTKRLLKSLGVRHVNVFPNGVDTTPLPDLDPKPLESPLRLITVCRLAPNKRVDHAISALRLLLNQGVDANLTIVGSGEVERQLRQSASDSGLQNKITFTGHLSEVQKNAALQRAHFLLHTSQREGWGLNVIEANAMGTPAIGYPVDGLVDSTVSGVTGFVTKEETPESIARVLAEATKDVSRYEQYRQNAWERSKTFAWKQVLPPACNWLEERARGRKQA